MKYFSTDDIYCEDEVEIFSKWTRKGFCLNIGCKQDYSNCNFVWKYKAFFLPKYKSFKYEILIKGSHDNFLIGEGSKYARSIISKSLMNDFVKENKTINQIRKEMRSIVNPLNNEFNKELNLFSRRSIILKKYNDSKKNLEFMKIVSTKHLNFLKKMDLKTFI